MCVCIYVCILFCFAGVRLLTVPRAFPQLPKVMLYLCERGDLPRHPGLVQAQGWGYHQH